MIQELPPELLLMIIKKMEIPTFLKMREVSNYFKHFVEFSSRSYYINLRRRDRKHFPKIEFSSENKNSNFQELENACKEYFKKIYFYKVINHPSMYPYYLKIFQKYSLPELKKTYDLMNNDFYLYTAVKGGKLNKNQVEGMIKLKNEGFYDAMCYDAVTECHPAFVSRIINLKSMTQVCDYFALKCVRILDRVQLKYFIRLRESGMNEYSSLKASKLLPPKDIEHIIKHKKNGYSDLQAFKEISIDMSDENDWFVKRTKWDFDFNKIYV